MSASRPTVVVIGAGFGGLNAAKALADLPVRTVVVDRNNYHLFTPLLYQVASALLDPGTIAQPVRSILRRTRNAEFRLGDVRTVDLDDRMIHTNHGDIAYDHLIIAAGSTTNYFGDNSLAESCFELKDLQGAVALRNRVLQQFEAARWENDPTWRRRLMSFAVVGAGPTGVEFCGALSELISGPLRRDFASLDIGEAEVHLVEGSSTVLSPFTPGLQRSAVHTLRRKGVDVRLRAMAERVEDGELVLKDGSRLDAGTVVWSAGVRAESLSQHLGVALEKNGTIVVERSLQLRGHPEVLVIGDMAAVNDDHGHRLPMLAPVAIQQATHAAGVIAASIEGRAAQPFHYHDKGIMATIGRNSGIMQRGPIRVSGVLGWLGWLLVHLLLILSFRRKVLVLFNWAWNYLLFDRPTRLILRADPDRPDPE